MLEILEAIRKYWLYGILVAICGALWLAWSLRWISMPSDWFGGGGYEIHFVGAVGITLIIAMPPMIIAENFTIPTKRFYFTVSFFSFGLLTVLEAAQYFQPWRHVEWWDWIAQNIGIAATLWFIRMMERRRFLNSQPKPKTRALKTA